MIINLKTTYQHMLFILLHIMILFIFLIYSYITWESTIILDNWSSTIVLIGIPLMVSQLISFYYKKILITDFRIWFICLSYLFMFGRVILNAFSLDTDIFWNLIVRHSSQDLYHSSLFILACLQSMFIGFTISEVKRNNIKHQFIYKEPKENIMFKAGLILLILSLPFRVFDDLMLIIQTQSAGSYTALTGRTGIADDIAFLTVPSLIYIITSGRFNKKNTLRIVFTAVIYLGAIMILTGDRRYSVTAILAMFLCYLKLYGVKFNVRSLFKYVLLSVFSLNLFIVIREIRATNLVSLTEFFRDYGTDLLLNESLLTETLGEFGLTFFSVVNIFRIVPSTIPFQLGRTFIVSLPAIFPVGWLFTDLFNLASLSGQVNPIVGTSVGSSLIGDLYGNFYWYGILAAILAGVLLSKMFKFDNLNARISCAKYYSLFYILINLVRANFFEVLRPAILVYFMPIIVIWITNSKLQDNKKFKIKKRDI